MRYLILALAFLLGSCRTGQEPTPKIRNVYKTFAETRALISAHTDPVILKDGPRQVVVAPGFAGRVMVSTLDGDRGLALGWIKEEVVTGKLRDEHFVNYGAAERLWLAPEGGQFALYFAPGTDYNLENWYVPAAFNNTELPVLDRKDTQVMMGKEIELQNWSGTKFKLALERAVSLLSAGEIEAVLGTPVPGGVKYVAYKSHNIVRNAGLDPIARGGGLVAIWILGMFTTEGDAQVMIPYIPDERGGKGPKVKSDYFGKVPSDRLKVLDKPPVVLFKADANYRSKIGLSPRRTTGVMGSIDWKRSILTIVKTPVVDRNGLYVNNAWEPQERPFAGDAVNAYNDGPSGPEKKQFGFFYEMETLSPAKELAPGESLKHDHITIHFQGPLEALKPIALKVLGVDLETIPHL